jgi:regulation of enolase protein 1 (concanavalin A-like superfamily)
VPAGKPGANVSASALARLVGHGGSWMSTPVIRTEAGAHHYRLQFLHIDGAPNLGWGTLVALGENQATEAAAPHSITLDRVYLNAHPTKGMKRGVTLNGRSLEVLNSYVSGFRSTADAQAIAGWNGSGPFRIINNYLEAAGENIIFGGADPKIPNLVPGNIEIRNNFIYKRPEWRDAILKTPAKPSASVRTGGTLPAGTHYFKVVAVLPIDGDTITSAASVETAAAVSANGAVSLSWAAVAGAEHYRIYKGTSSNGQNVYVKTADGATSLLYTGASQVSGAAPSSGKRWTAKNHLELKNAKSVIIDGNVFENNWAGFQNGYAILFTPKNQDRTAPWTVVKDITFTNNIVRHVSMGLNIAGYDYQSTTQQARNIRIANNVFEDVSGAYGNKGAFMLIAGGPADVVVDHNTIMHEGPALEIDGAQVTGFKYTNNMSKHNAYGVKGQNRGVGTDTLNFYFPGWVFRNNVLAGGPKASYPTGNFFPTVAEFTASFVNAAAGNYALVSGSALNNAGSDGRDIGVDMALIEAAHGESGGLGDEQPVDPPTPPPSDPPPSQPTTLPSGWTSEDVGSTGLQGSTGYTGGTFALSGAGADIWGTADAFHFAYRQLDGDGTIIARVASLTGSDAWTKVGVMIRASTARGAAQASMFVSRGKGLAFQRRTRDGGTSTHTAGDSSTAPRWVRLTRAGNTVTVSSSANGSAWTVHGSDTITLPATALVGLAITSHNAGAMASTVIDQVTVSAGSAVPSGWDSDDIGRTGVSGSTTSSGGTFTVKGGGADVWGTADALHFASRQLTGDGEIVARVAAISGSQPWTKVGVMIRQSLDAGAAQAFMLASTSKGFAFQRRTVTGGTSVNTAGGTGTAPRWVKLTRVGDLITASISTNGTTWTVVGKDSFSMSGPVYVGLAVSSHDASRLATGTFDNVTVVGQ